MPTANQKHRATVIAECGRACMYCGTGPLQSKALHIGLKDLTGPDEPANWLVACLPCSRRRADMSLADYAAFRLEQLRVEQAVLQTIQAKTKKVGLASADLAADWE